MDDDRADEEFRAAAMACVDGLFGFAYALSRNRAVAQDLVQEAYVRALAARHKAAPDDNIRGWLFTILHNVWKNEVRRRRPEALEDSPALIEALADPGADPERLFGRREAADRLRGAIEALPAHFREVVALRCVEGFSYREVATILGCPAGTVMSRLARARSLLRGSLEPGANGGGRP